MAKTNKYKLKMGTFSRGSGENMETFSHSDPKRCVIESEVNLATRWPEKFELHVSDEDEEEFQQFRKSKAVRTAEVEGQPLGSEDAPKVTREQNEVVTEAKLREMTKQELVEFAAENQLDITGAKTKDEIILKMIS